MKKLARGGRVREGESPQAERRHDEVSDLLEGIGAPEPAPFRPDQFQLDALAALDRADVIVSAPTGAGKTWIAVEAIRKVLASGSKAWYTSPLKALSNSKYRELRDAFGADHVGIATGDRQENLEADVLIATTEIYRNRLYDVLHGEATLTHTLVVFDEAHYLADPDRGVTWEEAILFTPPSVHCLLLSATVPNARELARWMQRVRGVPVEVVGSDERPVPMRVGFVHPYPIRFGPFWVPSGKLHPDVRRFVEDEMARERGGRGQSRHRRHGRRWRRMAALPPRELVTELRSHRLLPVLVFMGSRAGCDASAEAFALPGSPMAPPSRQEAVRRILNRCTEDAPAIAHHRHFRLAIERGVASHHAGHHPAWKLALESLMNEGLLDALFSTTTMAAGVDFPTRTVVITQAVTWDGREERSFLSREVQQMTGRAGRRGKDRVGFAVIAPGPAQDIPVMAGLLRAKAEPIESQFRPGYTMALNLLKAFPPEAVKEILGRSFAQYQREEAISFDRDEARRIRLEIDAMSAGAPCADRWLRSSSGGRGLLRRLRGRAASGWDEDEGAELATAVGTGDLAEHWRSGEGAVADEPERQTEDMRGGAPSEPGEPCPHGGKCARVARMIRRREVDLRRIEAEEKALTGGLWEDFQRYQRVLADFDYLGSNGRPNERGRWAALLRTDHPLLIAEMIAEGILNEDAPLLALAGGLAGEDRIFKTDPELKPPALELLVRTMAIARRIEKSQRREGIHERIVLNLGAAWVMSEIAAGHGWPDAESDEGDVVKLVWRSLDILRQLGNLFESHPAFAARARAWVRKLQEDPELMLE